MSNNLFKVSILLAVFVSSCELKELLNDEEYLDRCLDGRHHKSKPGPEDKLHSQCTPWAQRSCCTEETTQRAHVENMYNFDWDHCKERKPMSAECRKHFVQDLCFYECSPNTGPWLVQVQQKIRNERFVDVPLCASDCNAWFDACKDDYTCTNNWGRNFDWVPSTNTSIKGKVNKCPVEGTCDTFKNVFQTAKDFCEHVWDHSWKYTNDKEPCMRLWFNANSSNPNDAVSKWKVEQLKSISGNVQGSSIAVIFTIIFALIQL